MSRIPKVPELDPTDDTGAAGGASGGGDDGAQGYNLPPPTENPDEQRSRWKREGAKPKKPYAYKKLPQQDKDDIPMSKFPQEKSRLPPQKGTAETSFIEGETSGRIRTADSMKIELAHQTIANKYPEYGKDGNLFTLEVEDGKVVVVGSRGGRTRLFKADGQTLNPQLLKLKNVQETLGPTTT